jgi:hypothetical protein
MSRRLDSQLLDAASAINAAGTIGGADIAQIDQCGVYVEFGAGVTGGVVKIETASEPTYTGTWAVLATINWATAATSHYTPLTGVYRALRVRISTTVANGTVNSWFAGNVT